MNFAGVFHEATAPYSYAVNAEELVLRLQTDLQVERVFLHWGDPFEAGILGGAERWTGQSEEITETLEFMHLKWWIISIKPPYKRCRYYFELRQGDAVWLYGEDGFCSPEDEPACFYQPWLNPADIPQPPQWVRDTVWYQIFPDRFCRGNQEPAQTPWRTGSVTNAERFGGDLLGIEKKLDYLEELGINGLYLTPIFAADSVHKYDTRDYEQVDPDFGTDEDLIRLVRKAHEKGIRVMLDAVFNHCGANFAPWVDVQQKGRESAYWDWFMVHQWPIPQPPRDTRDHRYYSFAFASDMPKLNTNHPEVIAYFCKLCAKWVQVYDIDGIRFDVGNEVSHRMLKAIHQTVRGIRPDIYLLGEIWHDASPWLAGDEYDAVMNYPLQMAVNHFFGHTSCTAQEFGWKLQRCLGMYRRQTAAVMFNLFDSHDTNRLFTRAGNEDIFFQQLVLLFTLPGSPNLYYGTEIGLEGGHDPDCRRCMPWNDIDTAQNKARRQQVQTLIHLRRTLPELHEVDLRFVDMQSENRWVYYQRGAVEVLLNCGTQPWSVGEGQQSLFARKLQHGILQPGGILIRRESLSHNIIVCKK